MTTASKWRAAARCAFLAASILPGVLPRAASAADTARNPWRQPYTSSSPWNTPVGSSASLRSITVSPNGIGYFEGDVTYLYLYNPADPQRNIYAPGGAQYFTTRLPDNFLSDQSYGFSPNNPAFFVNSADTYGLYLQPFTRSSYGSDITNSYNYSNANGAFFSILGDGLNGAHFGSGLPSDGGCLRVDELTNGNPIRHALQIELPTYRLYKNTGVSTNRNGTYRWPANTSDNDISDYGAQNTSNADLCMGSLLTLPSNATEASVGVNTAAGKRLFFALKNYGAYIVDTSGFTSYQPNNADYVNIGIESAAKQQFRDTYGYEFAVSPDGSSWFNDLNNLYKSLVVVSNNGPTTVGGGGTARDSGRIAALAYGVRKNVSGGTTIEVEDYNTGGQDNGYHDGEIAQLGRPNNNAYYSRDGGDGYRNDGVDIYPTADADSCAPGFWAVGWTAGGEWLKYDINVTSAGNYTISVRTASGASGGQLHFEDENGNTLGGTISVPGTGNWDSYGSYSSASFALSSGNHTIRLAENTGGYNINYFQFVAAGGTSGSLVNGTIYQIEPQCAVGKGLDVENANTGNGGRVQTYDYLGGSNQKWKAIDVGNGQWEFQPQHATSLRLDVTSSGTANFTKVQTYTTNSSSAQRWKLYANGDGSFDLEPQHAPGKRLDVNGSSPNNNADVQIYDANNSSAQHWKFYVK